MSDGFVEQDTRPAGAEYDRHFTCRRRHGVKLHNGLTGSFVSKMLGGLIVLEEIERDASAATSISTLRDAIFLASENPHAQSSHRLAIETEDAVAVGYEHLAKAIR